MAPTIHNLELVKYPVTIKDQREYGYDPDLSFPFESETETDTGDHGYPCVDDCEIHGSTTISFTASTKSEFVNKVTEYLVTCYNSADVSVEPRICYNGTLSFTTDIETGSVILI